MGETLTLEAPELTETPVSFGKRLREAREAARYSQQDLAKLTGLTKTWIGRLERGQGDPKYPTMVKLSRILPALILSLDNTTSAQPDLDSRSMSPPLTLVSRTREMRPIEVGRLPVYIWGSRGDPRNRKSGPDADHEDYPPVGRESLVGPNGFGVVVRGGSMAHHGICEGDVVWVNPDRPAKVGRPTLLNDRSAGLVIVDYDGSGEVIGPVVVGTRTFVPD